MPPSLTIACLFLAAPLVAGHVVEPIRIAGIEQPVEILRDRWGVPHIYAQNPHDLFFAQGYVTAGDRLFQIDLWRRIGTGKLAEALGPAAVARDRLARSVRYRGDMDAEWNSYSPDTRLIATAFTSGINAYIHSLGGKRFREFQAAGYDPGLWAPEDCLARVAGLLMTRNVAKEVSRSLDTRRYGLEKVQELFASDPAIALEIPRGLDLADITHDILRVYNETIGPARFADQGSNNWVVDGALSVTGRPILANDPHRPVQMPSLRKAVHLVAPGWNAIGSGEPALPGIAVGHNDRMAFGFTTVGTDQQDLYVEKLNPQNPDEYRYRGGWRRMEIEHQQIKVKGRAEPETVELRYTIHGPVIHEDRSRHRAYALRWVGAEPGAAGYLAGLAVSRARNWQEFLQAVERYKVPAENIVYADVDGNIGWQVSGFVPIRKNWSGLYPVAGDTGEYEWAGFRKPSELPRSFNPPAHFLNTSNQKILPPSYPYPISYEWAAPFRALRVREMLEEKRKFSVADFERMQQDVTSLPARRFQSILRRYAPPEGRLRTAVQRLLQWDAVLSADSAEAAIYEVWIGRLPVALFGPDLGARVDLEVLLHTLELGSCDRELSETLTVTLNQLQKDFGPNVADWKWGRLHQIHFVHPLNQAKLNRGPIARPGDGFTVNSTAGSANWQSGYRQTSGASYREIFDLSDWDQSVMTNVPGESGDPESPHFDDLLGDWAAGRYHPMPFSRKAVEAATVERFTLIPAK